MLHLDKELVERNGEFGFNLSKTFENHLKQLITQFSTCNSANNSYSKDKNDSWCGRRDLNPGSQAWKACVLNQLDDDRHLDTSLNRKQENKPISNEAEEAIINTLIAVKANGNREGTCRQINYKLKELARNANIFQPEAVKKYISEATNQITGETLSQQTRNKFAYAYSKFCEIHEIFWKRPYYKVDEKIPLIPTTENVELIINNASQKYATIFTILAETGAEGKELEKTDRDHIDTEQGIINITGCKGARAN